ncbi:MAG: D-hexose-6-phosphate mutarotase [Chloroflexi bacterium]|nr:D-hexose-6-phosphate mutarotase [Chloroflexota bacterium]
MTPPILDPLFAIAPGAGDLPRLALVAPDGARAEVYLHGAHVASWVPAGGQERLFLSRTSAFSPGAAIRGGVPVVFPQFSGLGPLPKHGFARVLPWGFIGAAATADGAAATFQLHDSEASRGLWANAFLAELTVSTGGKQLVVTLAVTNTGAGPFTFTTALHTYLAVADIAATTVEGLAGLRYRDAAAGGVEGVDAEPQVRFAGQVDRIYFDVPAELRVIEPARTTVVRSAGFPDAVVWNPGAAKAATLADLEPDGYRRFVCVEAAVIAAPVRLAPGERWQGTQTLVT